eukprot:1384449-Pyramimonas_sp.AAC.1
MTTDMLLKIACVRYVVLAEGAGQVNDGQTSSLRPTTPSHTISLVHGAHEVPASRTNSREDPKTIRAFVSAA